MSAPLGDTFILNGWLPALMVVGASLLGSGHCVGMCGPLVILFDHAPRINRWAYHLGRGLGYTIWGIVAGAIGNLLLRTPYIGSLAWLPTVALTAYFIAAAYKILQGQEALRILPKTVSQLAERGLRNTLRRSRTGAAGSALAGLSSSLLPCGWLHLFVAAAITTSSAWRGGILLLLFWVGTLPALIGATHITRHFLKPLTQRHPRIVATTLLLAALFTLGTRVAPLLSHPASSPAKNFSCH